MKTMFFLLSFILLTGCGSGSQAPIPTNPNRIAPTSLVVTPSSTSVPTPISSSTPEATFELPVISVSPDNNWKAVGYSVWEVQAFLSEDGKTRWDLKTDYENNGWFDWSYTFYRWSIQGDSVYLTIHPRIDGFVPFFQGSGLFKLNLSNGTISEILHNQAPNLSTFALAPDENLLSYTSQSDGLLYLNIRAIDTDVEKQIKLNGYNNAGDIIWSPNQDQLVLSMSNGNSWEELRVSIALVNLQNNSITILYDNQQMILRPKEWLGGDEIIVSNDDIFYIYNLMTKELREFENPSSTP